MVVFFFGDSITQGFWDSEGGWATRVRKSFDKKYLSGNLSSYVSFFNLGVDGNTAGDVIERFDNEVEMRLWPSQEYSFVFAIGANDTIFRDNENFNEPANYEKQLSQIYIKAQKYSKNIIFLGLLPVQDELLNPMPWSKSGKCYSTERMHLFNETLKKFCGANNITYIDLWSEFEQSNLSETLQDGIHPSDAGHDIIARRVIKELGSIV